MREITYIAVSSVWTVVLPAAAHKPTGSLQWSGGDNHRYNDYYLVFSMTAPVYRLGVSLPANMEENWSRDERINRRDLSLNNCVVFPPHPDSIQNSILLESISFEAFKPRFLQLWNENLFFLFRAELNRWNNYFEQKRGGKSIIRLNDIFFYKYGTHLIIEHTLVISSRISRPLKVQFSWEV